MEQGFKRNFKATTKLYFIYKLISKEFNEYLKLGSMLEARKLFKQVIFERNENSLFSVVLPYGRHQ